MGIRRSTQTKYLKIVQAYFYGASKWHIAEELNVSPDTVNRALKWYRKSLDDTDYPAYLRMVIQETRNHIQHLWAYIKKLQDGLPDVVVWRGDVTATKMKHFPSTITQAHKRIIELRQFVVFCMKQLQEQTGGEGEEEIYDMTMIEPTDEEMEQWELKMITEGE